MRLSRSASAVLARVERLLYVLIWLVTMLLAGSAGVIGYALGMAEGSADSLYKLRTLQSEYDMLKANYDIQVKRRNALELSSIHRNIQAPRVQRGTDSSHSARQDSGGKSRRTAP